MNKKEYGIYYTPNYIAKYIVKNTVGQWIKENNNIENIKIIDPACGDGVFLIEAYKYLKKHSNLSDEQILTNNIYGVDLDNNAVELCKYKLCNLTNYQFNLDNNIKCGNSLIDDPEISGDKAFKWEKEFPDIMENGGFDVIVGNPPYGAKYPEKEQIYLNNKFIKYKSFTKNSVIYFIYLMDFLLNKGGLNSYIIPKSICYSIGWNNCAKYIINGLIKFIDVGKVFEEVKLEQVIFIRSLKNKENFYINGLCNDEKITELTKINKNILKMYNVLLSGQTNEELNIIKKIINNFNHKLGEYVYIKRGLNWQSKIYDNKGDTPIYRGSQLNRYYIDKTDDFVNLNNFNKKEYEYLLKPKILNQLAIAHIKNPYPHFYLQATLDESNNLVFETISCTFVKKENINIKFILALNNSKLFSWILYKFIYSNAIRSTRYDEEYIKKIPCPDLEIIQQQPFIDKAEAMLNLNKELNYKKNMFFEWIENAFNVEKINTKLLKLEKLSKINFTNELKKVKININNLDIFNQCINIYKEIKSIKKEIDKIDDEIDNMVFDLYKLNNEEKEIIKNN